MVDIPINDLNPRIRYVAAGGETVFPYPFPIFKASQLRFTRTNPLDLNNPVTLVLGVDYTLTGIGVAGGGNATLIPAAYPTGAAAGFIYTLYRLVPYERVTDFQFSGDFTSEQVNTELDYQTMMIQQVASDLKQTPRLAATDELQTLPILIENAARRSQRTFVWNLAGNGIESGPSIAEIEDAGGNAALALMYMNQTEIFRDQAAANLATATATIVATTTGLRDQSQTFRDQAQAAQAAAEAAASGMKWKTSVRASTTAALPTNTYANGTLGVGATLTASANGALGTQDGVAMAAGQRLLVKNEVTTSRNGIYVVTSLGSAGTPWIMTRASDMDIWGEVPSATVGIEEGTTLADTIYICTSNQGGTMGTTGITWIQYGGVSNTLTADFFAGTGAQANFTLSGDPGSANNMEVIVGGVRQYPGVHFTQTGTTLTFIAGHLPPTPTGDWTPNNVMARYGQTQAINIPASGSVQYSTLAAALIGTLAEMLAGTANKVMTAAIYATLYSGKSQFVGSNTSSTAIGANVIPVTTVTQNRNTSMNVATGIFTAPRNGDYLVAISCVSSGPGGAANIYKNGANTGVNVGTSNGYVSSLFTSVTCNAGDTISVVPSGQAMATVAYLIKEE